MLIGAHILLYSEQPDADRAFCRDVLELPAVDVGGGWLIFGLPAAEAAFHPMEDGATPLPGAGPVLSALLYLMCDDLGAYIATMESRGVRFSPVEEEPWGLRSTIRLPSGGELGVYQPAHPTALSLWPRGPDGA